jgi:hypothetical protein
MSAFHNQLFPFASQVVKVIELLDHESFASLAVSRGDVVTIQAIADSATSQILARSITGQRARVG